MITACDDDDDDDDDKNDDSDRCNYPEMCRRVGIWWAQPSSNERWWGRPSSDTKRWWPPWDDHLQIVLINSTPL